jgi:hypothetical protein
VSVFCQLDLKLFVLETSTLLFKYPGMYPPGRASTPGGWIHSRAQARPTRVTVAGGLSVVRSRRLVSIMCTSHHGSPSGYLDAPRGSVSAGRCHLCSQRQPELIFILQCSPHWNPCCKARPGWPHLHRAGAGIARPMLSPASRRLSDG